LNRIELAKLMSDSKGELPCLMADLRMASLKSGPDSSGLFSFQVPGEPAQRELRAEEVNHLGGGSLEEKREAAFADRAVFGAGRMRGRSGSAGRAA
jgi:hypothetical protein